MAGGDLGRRFAVDTNLVGRDWPGVVEIQALAAEGQVQLIRADAVDTELHNCTDEELRLHLLAISAQLSEQLGVMVWDHSRWDHSVWGNEGDLSVFDRVWAALQPTQDRSTASRHDVLDAMHVWTAIRYGADALLTMDGAGKKRGLLQRDAAINAQFDGFHIWTPSRASAFLQRLLNRQQSSPIQLSRLPSMALRPATTAGESEMDYLGR